MSSDADKILICNTCPIVPSHINARASGQLTFNLIFHSIDHARDKLVS